jgi:hypothetical protein
MKQLFKRLIWWLFAKLFPKHEVERLVNNPGNEMWRAGGGYHAYRKYFRIDWGTRGWRFVRKVDYFKDYWERVYPSLTPFGQKVCDNLMEELMAEGQANPTTIPHQSIVRGGGMVIRERIDLWQKLWARGESLLRNQ